MHSIPFFTDILIVGAHAALSSWVNLWARLCQTFHYSFPGGCEPSDYMDMLPLPSAVKEAPVLQEEYIPLFFVKIYKTARVSKQFDPLFCFFLLNCTFDVSVCFCWSDRSISFSLSGLWRSDWCYSKMSYEHAVRHMYRFKGWPLPALLQRKGLQNTETGLNTYFLSFFICEETGEKCIPCRPDSEW